MVERRRFIRDIASANQNGGYGKTTTAINLSSSLSLKGQRMLLIDFDLQAHATMGLNVKPSDLEKSNYDVILYFLTNIHNRLKIYRSSKSYELALFLRNTTKPYLDYRIQRDE